jgi:hypothetical protein
MNVELPYDMEILELWDHCTAFERAEFMTMARAYPDHRLRPENFELSAEEKEAVETLEPPDAALLKYFLIGSKIQYDLERTGTFYSNEEDRVPC